MFLRPIARPCPQSVRSSARPLAAAGAAGRCANVPPFDRASRAPERRATHDVPDPERAPHAVRLRVLAAARGSRARGPRSPAGGDRSREARGARPEALQGTRLSLHRAREHGRPHLGFRRRSRSSPANLFVATGTGGLFKTANLGTTWTAVFDKEAVASIGAVTRLAEEPRRSSGSAPARRTAATPPRGARASTAPRTAARPGSCRGWRPRRRSHASSATRRTATRVYVAALGRLWGENPERGVFRTRDGGSDVDARRSRSTRGPAPSTW